MRNKRWSSWAALAVGLTVQTVLTLLPGCSVPAPTPLKVARTLGTRDSSFVDRPLSVAATREGAMVLALRADGQPEVVRLGADRSPVATFQLAGQLGESPHEFGLLPDGRLAVRTRADKVQLFSRGTTDVYAVSAALPQGGPLAVASDGDMYVAVDNAIRRYSADAKLLAGWTVPGKPAALAWNGGMKRVCAFLPATGPEQLRLIDRVTVYASPSYASAKLGALERGVFVTVPDGSAPMSGFIRITSPFFGFIPVGSADSIIGTLCQYTPEGGTGSLLTVSCNYAPRCTANRRCAGITVSPDGLVFVLLHQTDASLERLVLVSVDETGFGRVRGGTMPCPVARRPLLASIPDVQSSGLACSAGEILVADGRRLWRGPVWGSGFAALTPGQPAAGTFREPLALAIDPAYPDAVTVLDWLRGDVQKWAVDGIAARTDLSLTPEETAVDILTDGVGRDWVAVSGTKSARVALVDGAESHSIPGILTEDLSLSAWWLEPGDDANGPPSIMADWGEHLISYVDGAWTTDEGSFAYPWQRYLPDSGADIAAYLRRAGLLPKGATATAPDWTPLIRGMARGPQGRFYIATGRTSSYAMRVFVFDADGRLEAQYRLPPDVGLPSDIAVDSDGHIWLTDPEHYRVVELMPN